MAWSSKKSSPCRGFGYAIDYQKSVEEDLLAIGSNLAILELYPLLTEQESAWLATSGQLSLQDILLASTPERALALGYTACTPEEVAFFVDCPLPGMDADRLTPGWFGRAEEALKRAERTGGT